MIKRTVTLIVLLLAFAAPAALADTTPPQPTAAKQHVQNRLQKVRRAYLKHCGPNAKNPDAARCAQAVQRLVDRLQKLESRIDARVAKIQQVCGAANPPAKCANAQQAIDRLQKLKDRIDRLVQKLQGLGQNGNTGAPTTSDQQSVDQLNQELDALAQQLP